MKISQLIDQLYWVSKFGKPVRKISSEELFANPELIENPVFFLSTGRCGTEWFTHVLKKANNTVVFHDPIPNLSVQNKFIFNLYQNDKNTVNETAKHVLFAAREQHFRFSYKADKRYVETNNHITFFAHALAELFPSAKFVHLYRHPGDFTASGMNRGWFDHNKAATGKMITPVDQLHWKDYSSLEKISWLWNETNQFVEDFKKTYPDRSISYDFTKRSLDDLSSLFQFLNIPLSNDFLKKSLNVKRNTQKNQDFPSYQNWDKKDQEKLKAICGELSDSYRYEL